MQYTFYYQAGRAYVATVLHSTACRMVMMLGAHTEPAIVQAPTDTEEDWHGKRYLRRLFWHCYTYDKDIAARSGHAPVIDDDYCDLTLPPGYNCIDALDDFVDNRQFRTGDVRLSIIKSDAIRRLYSFKALKKPDAEILRDIRELDDSLEAWRLSLPPRYRPSLSPAHRIHVEAGAGKTKQVHIILLHLDYYALIAMIHNASGRCRAWPGSDQMATVTSCQALALQASRSTIINCAQLSKIFNWGDFWYVLPQLLV
jgi:hypothetical protein